jgi:amino acid transporter
MLGVVRFIGQPRAVHTPPFFANEIATPPRAQCLLLRVDTRLQWLPRRVCACGGGSGKLLAVSVEMGFRTALFGKPLRSDAEAAEQIDPGQGIPVLGLDALASASYGPEAALTILLVAGAAASREIVPVSAAIIGLLLILYFSYRQTLGAYPNGGGSFTVAKENLGPTAGLVAAAALAIDYILNAAVAISAGVGATVSAIPALHPYTLVMCLTVLVLLTAINLRGIRSAGLVFMTPTYAFIGTLGIVIVFGVVKTVMAGGNPVPAAGLPRPQTAATSAVGLWLLMRAFASGCTAMTGIEAVSNGVPLFRKPTVRRARRTLTLIVLILVFLLGGLALLVRAYGITATPPGEAGYQSVVSLVVAAVMGRGVFYYITMTAVLVVLALSANTSFADFPRVCRVLAGDRYLPPEFARRGSRLVFTTGIVVLAVLAGILLLVFRGVTDHLIPLFAIGALLAFTMSQLGMVAHWRRSDDPGWRTKLAINAVGALATSVALMIVMVSKFTHGAWITALVIPAFVLFFRRMKDYNEGLASMTHAEGPLDLSNLTPPIVVIPMRRLDLVGQKALRFALTISPEVYVVQILAEELDTEDLQARWRERVEDPVRRTRTITPPQLVVIRSPYRQFFERFLPWLRQLTATRPDRQVIVLIPELVQRRWYQFLISHRAMRLKAQLLLNGGPHVSVMSTPWYPDLSPAQAESRATAMGRTRDRWAAAGSRENKEAPDPHTGTLH